jgi:DNA-binding MurR/RpiR family transcriptional regulator
MPPLLKIRSERDQMSAIERRIADFLLENSHLLRDYSSQQLADALNISQSSVVKFSQKLGFKGYPDLKFSIGEAVARSNGGANSGGTAKAQRSRRVGAAETLWQSKTHAEEETRAINTPDKLEASANVLDTAGKIFVFGLGEDGVCAQGFAAKLAALGLVAVSHSDLALMTSSIAMAAPGDALIVISEHGKQSALGHVCRQFRERRCKVISVTRNTGNALRVHADVSLLISAHDDRAHIAMLTYQSALQHVLDLLYALLVEDNDVRLKRLHDSLQRMRLFQEG